MKAKLRLSGDKAADALLSNDPLALLIGMVLDQQIPLERAFSAPAELAERLGGRLEAGAIASMDPGKLASIFAEKPALHRYPSSMASRVQELCRVVEDEYGGDAARIWAEAANGEELLARVRKLPGFGEQKAKIFVALLGKQMGVRPSRWREACRPFGDEGTRMSIADITDESSLAEVRAYKQELKAKAKASASASSRSSRTSRGADPGQKKRPAR